MYDVKCDVTIMTFQTYVGNILKNCGALNSVYVYISDNVEDFFQLTDLETDTVEILLNYNFFQILLMCKCQRIPHNFTDV